MTSEQGKNKYLFKNTVIFAVSNISTKIITFLLIPLFTYKLTASEYGVADLLLTICSFLYPLFTLNIAEAIFRFSMDAGSDSKKIVKIGIRCFLLLVVLGVPASLFLKLSPTTDPLVLLFYLYLVSSSACQILLALTKGQEKLKVFTTGNIINSIATALLAIIFLQFLNMKLDGYFLAYIISGVITTCYVLLRGHIHTDRKTAFDKKLFAQMVKYSSVLIPTTFMWWIINSSDKVMITNFISSAANGIYAVSYKIPSLLTVVASIFNQAWVFSAVRQKDEQDNEKYTNSVFETLASVITTVAVLLLLFIKPVMHIAVAPEYYEAWKYTPFLIFGFIFLTLSTFVSSSYNAHKDSKGMLISGLVGALANIALNAILIPLLGVYGAAIATVMSYIAVFTYRILDTKKYVKIRLSVKFFISLVVLILACATTFLPMNIAVYLHIVEIIAVFFINRKTLCAITKKLKNALRKKATQ